MLRDSAEGRAPKMEKPGSKKPGAYLSNTYVAQPPSAVAFLLVLYFFACAIYTSKCFFPCNKKICDPLPAVF